MPELDLSPKDFPLPIPLVDNAPSEWTPQAVAELAKLAPEELNKHIASLLTWYVREDDVYLDQPGNEHWVAGYHMAKAVLAARLLQDATTLGTVSTPAQP